MDDHVDMGLKETAESGAKRAQRERDRSGVCREKEGEEKEKEERSTPQARGHGELIENRKALRREWGQSDWGAGCAHTHGEDLRQWERSSSFSKGSAGEATLKG